MRLCPPAHRLPVKPSPFPPRQPQGWPALRLLVAAGLALVLGACGGGGGGSEGAGPGEVRAPTVTLTAEPAAVDIGGTSVLRWTSTDATTCTASSGWSGSKLAGSTQQLTNLSTTQVYTLTCTGPGGSASASVTIGVGEPRPTLTLTAADAVLILGQSTTLTWTSAHATTCVASGGWAGSKGTTGTEDLGRPAGTQFYDMSCTGLGGTVRERVEVGVFPPPAAPPWMRGSAGDSSVSVEWGSQAGSSYAGRMVSTNLYVSTRPGIRPGTFVESASDQVRRGLSRPAATLEGFANGTPLYVVATDVAGGIEGPPSAEIVITPAPIRALVERLDALNDTGVTGCTDLVTASAPCPQPQLPNQDGDIGRDAAAAAGRLPKVGFGRAGFDFTKLDAAGAELPHDAPAWRCVRDNVTGLTWQVPTDSGLTDHRNTYTWYHDDPAVHVGYAGRPNAGLCTGSACDTQGFVRALNESALCGFRDWRLPTRRELFSLAVMEPLSQTLDPQVFPLKPPATNGFYWTSSISSFAGLGFSVWGLYVNVPALALFPKDSVLGQPSTGYAMGVR